MLAAAAAVFNRVIVRRPGGSLLPHIGRLRGVPVTEAVAVAEAADAKGLAGGKHADMVIQVQGATWQPACRRVWSTLASQGITS